MQSYNNDKTTIEQMPWKITHTHVISFVYMHSPPKNHAESLVDPDLRLRWGGGTHAGTKPSVPKSFFSSDLGHLFFVTARTR